MVAISCLLLENDGVFSASIPSQGRFLWTLGYKATTGLEFRLKYGLDYDVIMNYEHCNNQREIIAVCEYFFDSTQKSLFGICDELSLYSIYLVALRAKIVQGNIWRSVNFPAICLK